MSPISTAQLNPHAHTFCLSSHTGNNVLIPVLLNNTDVGNIRYTLTPLGYVEGDSSTGKIEYVELSAKDLKAIEASGLENLQVTKPPANSKHNVDDYDEYDDEEEDQATSSSHSNLQKTQSLVHIRIKKPGTVRLERVLDISNIAARLNHPVEIIVVPCPQAEFSPDDIDSVRCAGQSPDVQLNIDVRGVPPLSLRWFKETNGQREHFLVEGIEGGHEHHNPHSIDSSSELTLADGRRKTRVSRDLKIPLSVSVDVVGRHTYVLEEVIDGIGNAVFVSHPGSKQGPGVSHLHDAETPHPPNSKTIRSLSVLRRPSMSFKNCGPGNPTSLLIGNEASLSVVARESDILDAPWEVSLMYQPSADLEKGGGKRFKPWKKTLTTKHDRKDLKFGASAPGEYTILGIKGKVRKLLCDSQSLCSLNSCSTVKVTFWHQRVAKSTRSPVLVPKFNGRGYMNGTSSRPRIAVYISSNVF